VDVTVVDRQAHHLFQPLLYQVATDVLERRVVECSLLDRTWELSYDSLIVAAGSRQSYFGHDEFGIHAPGMKTIDDPLEVRGRIFGAFELAELEDDSPRRA
jgi:NADH dehydrogenase